MPFRPIVSALLIATALTACESQEAADHREAVAAIEAGATSLYDTPPGGEQAITHLKSVAKTLRNLRGLNRTLKSSQYRLLTQVDLQLANHIRLSGLETRVAAIDTAATIAALRGAAALQMRRLGSRQSTPEELGVDELAQSRISTIRQLETLQRQHQQRQPNLDAAEKANAEAAATALSLRTRAARLIAEATSVDAITGEPLRSEAAGLEYQAASIEADLEQRAAEMDMYARLELANLSIQTEGVSHQADAIRSEIERTNALATERRNHDTTGESALLALNDRLDEASTTLIDFLTGPLRENFAATMATLQQAAQSAGKVQGDRGSKDADQLARIQAQVAIMTLAEARSSMLGRSIRLLDEVAALGHTPGSSTWSETRQVLQEDWADADAVATQSRSEAISLIGGLGGETAAMLLGQLDDSGLPPEETYEPPTRPEPVLPRGDAGDSTDPALAALADTLVSIIGMPKSEQIPALRPLVDCDAPSQPCAMMDLDADMNKTVADFGAAIAASPLANDPTTAKVAAAVQAMAGGDEGEARQTTLEGVQQTAPNAATITCSATVPELGTSITLVTPAEKTANGWKLVGLPMPHGAPLPTLDQARTVLLAIKGITAKIQSGEIADAAALQQALTALAPR